MYNILNFKTIRYKPTASGRTINSVLNYKLMRLCGYLKTKKGKKPLKMNLMVEAIKK